jgi:hypothetical protein
MALNRIQHGITQYGVDPGLIPLTTAFEQEQIISINPYPW